eukprot:scaffold109845_cov44-Phaeocystis_antarctica.AAC.1
MTATLRGGRYVDCHQTGAYLIELESAEPCTSRLQAGLLLTRLSLALDRRRAPSVAEASYASSPPCHLHLISLPSSSHPPPSPCQLLTLTRRQAGHGPHAAQPALLEGVAVGAQLLGCGPLPL